MKTFRRGAGCLLMAAWLALWGCTGPTDTRARDPRAMPFYEGVAYNDGAKNPDSLDGKSFYFGNLHSHTAYSDGQGTPSQAFAWARDTMGYDFYAISDHGEQLDRWEWDDTGIQAEAYTQDGIFVALRGFEWSSDSGHACVYNTSDYTSARSTFWLSAFFNWVDTHNAYAQFNHPGRPDSFDDFRFNALAADHMVAVETGNKTYGNISGQYLKHYLAALNQGWHLAPTNNQDNHQLVANSHRTVIIADALTRTDLLAALAQRRVYSSDDPNMEVVFKIGAHWMGEVVNIQAGSYPVTVEINDDEPITRLEIIDATGAAVASAAPLANNVRWYPDLAITSPGFFFLKVTENDTRFDEPDFPDQITVTAPIRFNLIEADTPPPA